MAAKKGSENSEKTAYICLKNVDASFQSRSDSIFASLSHLEPTKEECNDIISENNPRRKRKNSDESQHLPRNRSRRLPARVPQHVLSPEKWIKYSLETDGSENFRGMNEHSLNSHAAHTFIAELRNRKTAELSRQACASSMSAAGITPENQISSGGQSQSKPGVVTSVNQDNELDSRCTLEMAAVSANLTQGSESKLSFRKPKANHLPVAKEKTWRNGTFVMPEYVAGSRRVKAGRRLGVRSGASDGHVTLGHLIEAENETSRVCGAVSGEEVSSGDARTKPLKPKGRVLRKRTLNDEDFHA